MGLNSYDFLGFLPKITPALNNMQHRTFGPARNIFLIATVHSRTSGSLDLYFKFCLSLIAIKDDFMTKHIARS